ncbi:MAG: hypothetical protein GY754_33165 [bacterium]|nr:hypothetical protein [bacterium]
MKNNKILLTVLTITVVFALSFWGCKGKGPEQPAGDKEHPVAAADDAKADDTAVADDTKADKADPAAKEEPIEK